MKISTKGRYGLRILLDLARHPEPELRLIRDIAASQQISEKYISRLVVELRRAGLLLSIRGAKGGFRLAIPPEAISVLSVIEAMEGPTSIVDCVLAPAGCLRSKRCAARSVWTKLNAAIRDSMNQVTLADLLEDPESTK